jgi:hypothetical protein
LWIDERQRQKETFIQMFKTRVDSNVAQADRVLAKKLAKIINLWQTIVFVAHTRHSLTNAGQVAISDIFTLLLPKHQPWVMPSNVADGTLHRPFGTTLESICTEMIDVISEKANRGCSFYKNSRFELETNPTISYVHHNKIGLRNTMIGLWWNYAEAH